MVRHFQPSTVLEVGGGFSTRVSAEAALRNGDTKVVCIEPYPEPILTSGFPGLTKLITDRVENVGLDQFLALSANDILFIDTSHCLKIGADVQFLYLEVLPRLKEGVIVHIHDIFFPKEMPRDWILNLHKFWTEQYLVQAFLAFNRAFEVLFCNSYMSLKYGADMKSIFPKAPWHGGGSLWIRRRNSNT
jgi:predicted O-methyltransferase YrrM